jgi:hypothetical protein
MKIIKHVDKTNENTNIYFQSLGERLYRGIKKYIINIKKNINIYTKFSINL